MAKKQKAGRKSVDPLEKVILVGFYTKRRYVEGLGGMVKVRERCKELVEADKRTETALG